MMLYTCSIYPVVLPNILYCRAAAQVPRHPYRHAEGRRECRRYRRAGVSTGGLQGGNIGLDIDKRASWWENRREGDGNALGWEYRLEGDGRQNTNNTEHKRTQGCTGEKRFLQCFNYCAISNTI
jgi:hypothetical protein